MKRASYNYFHLLQARTEGTALINSWGFSAEAGECREVAEREVGVL